jgi:hypothetical protein
VDYSPSVRLEDRLGPDEPAYRSRGEAQVGRLLDRYGIPFFYEMPTVIYDRGRFRVWRPDFTLPTYGNLIVEYAGMPDRPAYMDGVRLKQQAYHSNGIHALFLYPEDLQGRSWPRELARTIGRAGYWAQAYGRNSRPGAASRPYGGRSTSRPRVPYRLSPRPMQQRRS